MRSGVNFSFSKMLVVRRLENVFKENKGNRYPQVDDRTTVKGKMLAGT